MNQVQVPAYSLRSLEAAVANVQNAQVQLSHQLGSVKEGQEYTRAQVLSLRELVEDFIIRDGLAKNLQLAQTKMVGVRAQIETEFGHYAEVRRLATGLLEAADVGIVATSTIRQLSEELMLLVPRYWLAPAVVGLAAWMRDDRDLAERALVEALRRDHDKSTLFFALILRRYQRASATARWLTQYISRQDPNRLARDFMVVLDGVAVGTLGDESRPMVMAHVREWFDRIDGMPEVHQAQVDRWVKLIDGMRSPTGAQYKVLPAISPSWGQLRETYEGTTVYGNALKHFSELFERPVPQSADQRERVDAILESLVTRFDAEEQPARRALDELQAIIDNHGDHAAAQATMNNQQTVRAEHTDLLTLLTNAAFFPEQAGASLATQKLATALARQWIVEAADSLRLRNDAAMPQRIELTIDGWRGAITATDTQENLVGSLERHVETRTRAKIAEVKFAGAPLAAAVLGGVALLVAVLTFLASAAGAGVFFLLTAAAAGGYAYYQYQQLPGRREALRREGEQRKAHGRNKLEGAIAEGSDLRQEWEAQAAMAPKLNDYLSGLSDLAFVEKPADQSRAVNL